jgi:hypothetical protein
MTESNTAEMQVRREQENMGLKGARIKIVEEQLRAQEQQIARLNETHDGDLEFTEHLSKDLDVEKARSVEPVADQDEIVAMQTRPDKAEKRLSDGKEKYNKRRAAVKKSNAIRERARPVLRTSKEKHSALAKEPTAQR